jgi:hypothetical protein
VSFAKAAMPIGSVGAMATQRDVREIALGLPGTSETDGRFAFGVEHKGRRQEFVWVWAERVDPKKPRVANPKVLAVRVADLDEKEMLLASDPEKFFTEPHYNKYPAVLVRLAAIGKRELRELVTDAWRTRASRELLAELDDGGRG